MNNDTENVNSIGDGGEEEATPKATLDYFPMYAFQWSADQIRQSLKENDAVVTLWDREKAREKYTVDTPMIDPKNFDKIYDMASTGYLDHQDGIDHFVTPWIAYGNDTFLKQEMGIKSIDRNSLEQTYISPTIGVNQFGQNLLSPQEEVFAKGYYIDRFGKKIIKKKPTVSDRVHTVLRGLAALDNFFVGTKDDVVYDPKMRTQEQKDGYVAYMNALQEKGTYGDIDVNVEDPDDSDKTIPLFLTDKNDFIKIYAPGPDGTPTMLEVPVEDPRVTRSSIVSAMGPAPFQRNAIKDGIFQAYNMFSSGAATFETADEMGSNYLNELFFGGDYYGLNKWADRSKRETTIQNKALFGKSLRANQGMFNSWEGFSSVMGSVIAQLVIQKGLAQGLRNFNGFKSFASTWTSFGVFGLMSGHHFVQTARDMGIEEADIAWMYPIQVASETFTEGFIGRNVIARGSGYFVDKAARLTAAKKVMKKFGIKNLKEGTKTQKRLWLHGFIKAISEGKTIFARTILAGGEEGTEEFFQQMIENSMQTFHDQIRYDGENGLLPGKGLFGPVDANKSYLENLSNRIGDNVLESTVAGFMGGITMGLTMGAGKNPMADYTMGYYGVTGEMDKLRKATQDLYNKESLGPNYISTEGEIKNPESVDGSMNDVAYQGMMQSMDMFEGIVKDFGIDNPIVLEAIGRSKLMQKELTDLIVSYKGLAEQKLALENKEEATEEDAAQIAKIDEQLGVVSQAIQEYTVPEGADTKYSKKYNEAIREKYSALLYAKNVSDEHFKNEGTELTDKFRKSEKYQTKYKRNILDHLDTYEKATEFSQKLTEYQTQEIEKQEKIVKSNNETVVTHKDLFTTVGEASKLKSKKDLMKGFEGVCKAIIALSKEITFGIPAQGNEEQIQAIRESAKYQKQLEQLEKELNDEYATDPTNEDVKDQLNTTRETIDAITQLSENAFVDENTEKIRQLSNDDNVPMMFLEEMRARVDNFREQTSTDLNPSTAASLIKSINAVRDALKTADKGMFFFSKGSDHPKLEPSKNKELPAYKYYVSESELRNSREQVSEMLIDLDTMGNSVQLAKEASKFFQIKLRQGHINAQKQVVTLFYEMDPTMMEELVPDIKKLLEDVKDLTQEQKDKNTPPGVEEMADLLNSEKVLHDIFVKMQGASDQLVNYDFINRLLAAKKFRYNSAYFNAPDYTKVGETLNYYYNLLKVNSVNDVYKTHEGYTYLVNFLMALNGESINTLQGARSKVNVTAQNISTFEQMMGVNMVVNQLLGHNADVLKIVREVEFNNSEHIKKVSEKEDIFMANSIFMRGDFGGGKSQHMIPEAIAIRDQLKKDPKRKYLLVHHTQEVLNTLSSSLEGIDQVFDNISMADFIGGKVQNPNQYEGMIVDEASLLSKDNLQVINKNYNEDTTDPSFQIIWLGDASQMMPPDAKNNISYAQKTGARTFPVMFKFTTRNPVIERLAEAFRNRLDNNSMGYPEVYVNEYEAVGITRREGGKYYNTVDSVISDALSRPESVSSALVFLNSEQIDALLKDPNTKEETRKIVEKLFDKHGNLKTEFQGQVYVLMSDPATNVMPRKIPSIQGLRKDEVYMAVNLNSWGYKYNGKELKEFVASNSAYTAVGRASRFMGLVGSEGLNLTQRPSWWIDGQQEVLDTSDIYNDMNEYLKNIGIESAIKPQEKPKEVKTKIATPILHKFRKNGIYTINKGDDSGAFFKITQSVTNQKDLTADSFATGQKYKAYNELTKTLAEPFGKESQVALGILDPIVKTPAPTPGYTTNKYLTEYPGKPSIVKGAVADEVSTGNFYIIDSIIEKTTDGVVEYEIYLGGKQIDLNTFEKEYTLRSGPKETTDLDDIESGKTFFTGQAKAWLNGNKLWGTIYSVFNTSSADVNMDQLRKDRVSILNMVYKRKVTSELVYLKSALMEDRNTGTWKNFDNVLAIKVSAINEESLTSNEREILQRNQYIASLGETDAGYAKQQIRDYSQPLENIKRQISEGFDSSYTGMELSPEHHTANKEVNYYKASLRKKGYDSNTDEYSFGEIILENDINEGNVIYNKGPLRTFAEFMAHIENTLSGQMVTFSDKIVQTFYGSGRVGLLLKYKFSEGDVNSTANEAYVIFKTNNLGKMNSKRMHEKIKEDKQSLKDIRASEQDSFFGSELNRMFWKNVFAQNLSIITNNKALNDFFGTYFEKVGGRVNVRVNRDIFLLDSDNVRTDAQIKLDVLDAFLDQVTELYKDDVTGEAANLRLQIDKLYQPYTIDLSTSTRELSPSEMENIVTSAEAIHFPYVNISTDGLVDVNEEITNKTPKSSDGPASKKGAKRPRFEIKTDNIEPRTVTVAAVRELFEKIAHPSIWEQVKNDITPNLQFDGMDIHGLMYNGRIKLALYKKGIKYTTPKHEFFHLVFDYLIDENSRQRLYNATKELLGLPNATEDYLTEWMARDYGYSGLNLDSVKPKQGLWSRFVDFVNKLFNGYTKRVNTLDELFYKMDHGYYRNVQPVHDGGRDIVRMEGESELDEYQADNFNHKAEDGFAKDDTPNTDYIEIFNNQYKVFGNDINKYLNAVADAVIQYTFFSSDLSVDKVVPMTEAIKDVQKEYEEYGNEFADELTSVGIPYSQITDDDAKKLSIVERRNLGWLRLANQEIFTSFIVRLMPGYNPETGRFYKWNKQSTQYNRAGDDANPDQTKSDFMKMQINATRFHQYYYSSNGRLVRNEWDTKDAYAFVNSKDLEKSLKDAGMRVANRLLKDPSLNPVEAFTQELYNLATEAGLDTYKGSNILSFYHRFFEAFTGKPSLSNRINSIDELIKSDGRSNVSQLKLDIQSDLSDFINSLISYNISFMRPKSSFIESKKSGDETVYNIVNSFENTFDNKKKEIIDGISQTLYDKDTRSFREHVKDRLGSGKNAEFEVTSSGISYVKNKQKIKVISYTDGKISFTEAFHDNDSRDKILTYIKNFIGLKNVTDQTIYNMYNNMHHEGARVELNKRTPEYNLENTNTFLAETFMNMFWSASSNLTMLDKIETINKGILRKLDNKAINEEEAKKQEAKQIKELSVPFNQEMSSFRKKMNITDSTIDGFEKVFAGNNVETIKSDVKIYKPVDYYNAFGVIAALEVYNKGIDSDLFSNRPDGTKAWGFKMKSWVFDMFGDGSAWLTDKINNMPKEILDNSIWKNTKGKWTNWIADPKGIRIRSLTIGNGLRVGNRGIVKPGSKDLATINLANFIEGIRKSTDKLQDIFLTMTNIADKELTYITNTDFSFGKGRRLINIDRDSNGNITSANVDEKMISHGIAIEFERANREMQMSQGKFAREIPANNLTKVFPRELWSVKDLKNFNPKSLESFSKTLTDEQAIDLMRSGLRKNKDYFLDGNTVTLGNSILFKVPGYEAIYNHDNYQKFSNNGERFALLNKTERDKLFFPLYREYAGKLSQIGYRQQNDVKTLIEGKMGYFYTEKMEEHMEEMSISANRYGVSETPITVTTTTENIIWNPVYKAHFYAYHIVNNAVGEFAFGNVQNHKDAADKVKRSGSKATGGSKLVVNTKYGLPAMGKEIMVSTMYKEDATTGEWIENDDGGVNGFMLWESFMEKSGIDYQYGPIDKTRVKTLDNRMDFQYGDQYQEKESMNFFSSQTYEQTLPVRQMQKDLLDHVTKVMRKDFENYDIDLYAKFKELYEATGHAGSRDAQKAFRNLRDWIVEESNFSEEIKARTPRGFADETIEKQTVNYVNMYDPYSSEEKDLIARDFDNSSLRIVLNPYQETNKVQRQAPPSQNLSYMGIGASNLNRGKRIRILQEELYTMSKARINTLMGIEANKPEAAFNEQDIEKFVSFLRERGLQAIRQMGLITGYTDLINNVINNPGIIHSPEVAQKLKQAYRSFVNDNAIRTSFKGLRVNQSSSYGYQLYYENGIPYTLQEIERFTNSTIESVEDLIDLGYTPADLKDMTAGNEGIQRGQTVMPYPYMREFGIKNDETLNDVFTIEAEANGEVLSWNVRNLNDDEFIDFLQTLAEGGSVINKESSPIFRNSPEDPLSYFRNFKESLKVYSGRVPADRLGSASILEITAFINDNGNTAYVPVEMNIRNNADQDIDQLTVYMREFADGKLAIEGEGGARNAILDEIDNVYQDPANASKIFIKSDVKGLKELVDKKKRKYGRDNDFASYLDSSQTASEGNKAIGILAMSLSGVSYLAQLGKTFIRNNAPGLRNLSLFDEEQWSTSPFINLGNWMQVALDNAKELVLGRLGITAEAVPVVAVMTADGKSNQEIATFFEHPVVEKIYTQRSFQNSLEVFEAEQVYELVAEEMVLNERSKNTDSNKSLLSKREALETKLTEAEKVDENTPPDMNLIEELSRDIRAIKSEQERRENYQVLTELKKYVFTAEALRRMTRFVALRNGVPVMDFDLYKAENELSKYLGMTYEEFMQGAEWNAESHIENFKKLDNKYSRLISSQFDEANNEAEKLLDYELEIAKAINISEFVRRTHFKDYYNEINNQREVASKTFLEDNKVIWDYFAPNYLKGQLNNVFNYAKQFYTFKSGMQQLFLDKFFKRSFTGRKFNIAVPLQDIDGNYFSPESNYETVALDNVEGRTLFVRQFPQFHDLIRSMSTMNFGDASRAIQAIGIDYTNEFHDAIKNNKFIANLVLQGQEGKEYIRLADAFNLSEQQLSDLAIEFDRLPKYLKELYRVNQLINTGFNYRKGSINEIMGTEHYYGEDGLAMSLEMTKAEMEWMPKNMNRLTDLVERFTKWVQHKEGMSSFLTRKARDLGIFPETIMKRKDFKRFTANFTARIKNDQDLFGNAFEKYDYEYLIGERGGFDTVKDMTSTMEIVKMSPEKLDLLLDNQQVPLSYVRGHSYANMNVDRLEGLYTTEEGTLIRALRIQPTNVVWVKADLSEEQIEQAKENYQIKIAKQQEEKNQKAQYKIKKGDSEFIATVEGELVREIEGSEEAQKFVNKSMSALSKYVGKEGSMTRYTMIDFKKHSLGRLSTKAAQRWMDALKEKVTGVPITEGTTESLKGASGMFDGDGIHMNVEKFSFTMPVHEFQHFRNGIMIMNDPATWNTIKNTIIDSANNGDKLIEPIRDHVVRKLKEHNRPTTDGDVTHEVLAILSQIINRNTAMKVMLKESIRDFFTDNTSLDALLNIATSINTLVNNSLHDLFFPFRKKLDKIFTEGKVSDFLLETGRQTYGTDPVNYDIWQLDDAYRSLEEGNKFYLQEGVNTTKDFAAIVNPYSEYGHTMGELNTEEFVRTTLHKMKSYTDDAGNYVFHSLDKTFAYPNTMTDEQLEAAIEKDIVPHINSFEVSYKNNVQNFINLVIDQKETIYDAAKKAFGNVYSEKAVTDMAFYLGLGDKIETVMKYSDLKNSDIKAVRALYNSAFEGFDPLITIHGIEDDGTVDLSILDVTTFSLQDKVPFAPANRNRLLGTMMTDNKFIEAGGTWSNSAYDIRRAILSMSIMNMMKASGGKVKFRGMGVLEIQPSNVKSYMMLDIQDMFSNMNVLSQQDEWLNNLVNDDVKDIFTDKKISDSTKYEQSFVRRFQMYLKKVMDDEGYRKYGYGYVNRAESLSTLFMDRNTTVHDQVKALRALQKDLRGRNRDKKEKDHEDLLVSMSILELESYGAVFFKNSIKDMNKFEKNLVPIHNVRDDLLQMLVSKGRLVNSIVVDRYMKIHNQIYDKAQKVAKNYIALHPQVAAETLIKDEGSVYYKHLFKHTTLTLEKDQKVGLKTYKKGETVPIMLPILDFNNPKHNEDDKALMEVVWKTFRQRTIDNWYHSRTSDIKGKDVFGNSKISKAEVAKEFDESVEKGTMVIISKGLNETLLSGNFKAAWDRMGQRFVNYDEFIDDNLNDKSRMAFTSGMNTISNVFASQMNSKDKLYEQAGLLYTKNGLTVADLSKNMLASTNLEKIINYYTLEGIRTEEYENRYMPAFNDVDAVYGYFESTKNSKDFMVNNRRFAEMFSNRLAMKKNEDTSVKITLPGGVTVDVKTFARATLSAFSMISLGYKWTIGAKSGIWNEMSEQINALAASIANIGLDESQKIYLPTTGDVNKARYEVATNFKKARRLGAMFQLVNRTERDLIDSPWLNVANKGNILNDQWAHITNWASDAEARLVGMAGWMIHEGSWDAYSLNEKGDIQYDIKKDERYYNEDGTQTKEQEVLVEGPNGLKNRLKDQGLMEEDATKVDRGHDHTLASEQLKWYGDKFIIGSMDNTAKWLLGNDYLGAAASQFRVFSADKIWNAGLFASPRKTSFGAGFKAIQLENGEWVTQRDWIEIEGAWQSFVGAVQGIANMRNEGLDSWWKNQTPMRRLNLARTVIKTAVFSLLIALSGAVVGKDNDKKLIKLNWMYKDLNMMMISYDWFLNPFPVTSILLDIVDATFGPKKVKDILKYRTAIGSISDPFPSLGIRDVKESDY